MAKKQQPASQPESTGTELLNLGVGSGDSMTETQVSKSIAEAQITIQSALTIAKRFPRDEDAARARLTRACQRLAFAEDVKYVYPRGGNKECDHVWVDNEDDQGRHCQRCRAACIEGPSVYLAREALRAWGNAWSGLDVVADTEDERLITAWAWDLETNFRKSQQDLFQKLIWRRYDGGKWVKPDERDLRELTNRRGAFAERASILRLLPSDLINDALIEAKKTQLNPKDPDAEKKRIIGSFMELNVDPEMLSKALGGIKVGNASPKDLAWLRGVYKSIKDGQSSWSDYAGGRSGGNAPTPPKASTGKPTTPPPTASTNQGPIANGASAPSPDSRKIISNPQKGMIHATAMKLGWKVGAGKPDDSLHLFLQSKYQIESVAQVREEDFQPILDALIQGPEAHGFRREA